MNLLITGAFPITPAEQADLEALHCTVTFHQDERQPVENPERYEAVICNGLFLYNPIEQFTGLRLIQLTSAGMDRVPAAHIRAQGIALYNAAGVYSIPMAEWTLMRILELYKNAGRMYTNQSAHRWEKDRSWQELSGRTACIVGFGAYGRETAKRLKAFDVHVLAVNRSVRNSPWVDEFYPLEQLDRCLARADIVVLAIALTEDTRYLINKDRLIAMKPGAILVNAARGGLVEEAALLEALKSGRLAGAALDVFETEPLSTDSALWSNRGLLLSAHNAFVGDKIHLRLFALILKNLSLFTGE